MGSFGDYMKREASKAPCGALEDGGDKQSVTPPSGAREVDGQRRTAAWSVTHEFLHEGFLYRIMRRPTDEGAEVHLTPREDEALAHAYRGMRNKDIAQHLRVAPSTVGVLLFRAAGKFRVATRADLLAAYARLKGSPEPEST